MIKTIKKIDYRFFICLGLSALIIGLFFISFPHSVSRLIIACKDFGLSMAYYFCEVFGIPHDIIPSVTIIPPPLIDSPGGGVPPVDIIPITKNLFDIKMSMYWKSLLNGETWLRYVSVILNFLINVCRYLLIIAPVIMMLYIFYKRYYSENKRALNENSKPLKLFLLVQLKVVKPLINWCSSVMAYIRKNKWFTKTWILIFALYFNFYTIIIEFLAFYFYFVVSFNVGNIYMQVYKLFLDLIPMIKFVPLIIWVILGFVVFDKIRKKIGYKILNHHEMRNRGFINSLGQVSLICGSPGTGKTTALTDMALSQEVMFRDKAFELILENDMKFPNFPYAVFEDELKRMMECHKIYNLATTKKYVLRKMRKFKQDPCVKKCFGYDYKSYGLCADDSLKEIYLFDMLVDYAKLYFIYVVQSSLLVSNYSIREDSIIEDLGNFPLWNHDFFKRDSRLIDSYSRHAHIIDFDMFRLGKKMIENNKKRNAFEFGVVLISEGGKERGNQLENKPFKKESTVCNPLNDLFISWLKLARHSATVNNFPFIKIIFDEQRPESIGADIRELCIVAHIRDKEDSFSPLMFFRLETMIYTWCFTKFQDIYYKYRHYRSDNTLFSYLLKNVTAVYYRYYMRLYNRFSYAVQNMETEKGTLDGELKSVNYYLSYKKIYSKRFATDCFGDYFTERTLKSRIGLTDLQEFTTERATMAEMKKYNSRFINELINIEDSKEK